MMCVFCKQKSSYDMRISDCSSDVCSSDHEARPHESPSVTITIYHNPACGTSRNTLGLIRNAGIEPTVIEYLEEPPSRSELVSLIDRMGISPRELLRQQGTPYAELGLDNQDLTEDQHIAAMMEHPILINRPVVLPQLDRKSTRLNSRH